MLRAYTIKDIVVDREIDASQAKNLNIIITRVLGQDELGKPGEVKLFKIDKNIENHKLCWYAKEMLNQPSDKQRMIDFCDQLADDLLKAELTEDQLARNQNILEGILIIKLTPGRLILIKLEDVEAIDPETFEIKSIIGLDRVYLKAAIFTGDEQSIHVIDRQRQVANFWSSKFLKLIPVRTDSDNTQYVADAINKNQVFNQDTFTEGEIEIARSVMADYITKESHFDLQEINDLVHVKFPEKSNKIESVYNHEFLQSIDEQFEVSGSIVAVAFRRKIQVNELVSIIINNIYRAKCSQLIDGERVRSTRTLEIQVEDAYLNGVLETFTVQK